MESKLLAEADITFVTSPALYEAKKERAKKIVLSPNTANVPLFRDYGKQPETLIQKIKTENPEAKILGYQGNISGYKTDLNLLEQIATQFSECHLVLAGPVGWGDPGTDVSKLESMPNVHFAGRVDYEKLPGFVRGFDVCLLPLNQNESTKGSFPMKFYEYMACQKPIVATALPAFESYRDRPQLARIAQTPEEFLAGIKSALYDPGDEKVKSKRLTEALANDWEARVKSIGAQVTNAIREKGE